MLYLLDANILITANNQYYPMDQVPEFWSWLQHQGEAGRVKIPAEILDELLDDTLHGWAKGKEIQNALLLDEAVDAGLVRRVVEDGYASDRTYRL